MLTVAALALAAAAVCFTWYRVRLGVDLQDESFSVLTPWRWALGGRPFVDEMNLSMMAGFLTYPFVKAFAVARGGDATGIFLFMRVLYLLFCVAVSFGVYLFARTQLRWQLAVAIAAVYTTFVFWQVTDLTYNTLAAGFLTLGFVFGLFVVVNGRGPRYAFAAGLCHAAAVIAYPTLLFVMPFVAIALVLAHGRQAATIIAEGRWSTPYDPRPDDPPSGLPARRAVTAYAAGGAVPLGLLAIVIASFGFANVMRSWHFTMEGAGGLHQLGGAAKAVSVAQGLAGFIWSRPLLLPLALAVYLVFRWRPAIARYLLLLFVPVALYWAGQRDHLEAAGFVLIYGLLAPYLYLYVPRRRRADGAKLLIWVWLPSLVVAAMTGYTSAAGYAHGATGLYPALVASGLFLGWVLEEPAAEPRGEARRRAVERGHWIAFTGLAAVVVVTVAFQFQYQLGGTAFGRLTTTFKSGPWYGLRATPPRARFLARFDADLRRVARPDDRLLIYFRQPGLYFFWDGPIAANSTCLDGTPRDDPLAPIPKATIAYWRREGVVPSLVVHLCATAELKSAQLHECGGLGYGVVTVRPEYSINRRGAGEGVARVLARFPR